MSPLPALALLVGGSQGFAGLPGINTLDPVSPQIPWRAVVGLAAGVAVVVLLGRVLSRRGLARPLERTGVMLGALTLLTFAGRHLLVSPAFFHQNGQGPLWASYVLCNAVSPYGPGYHELFSWLLMAPKIAPEVVLFGAMSVVSAMVPALGFVGARPAGGGGARSLALGWVGARATGVRAPLAWAIVVILAADPALARVAESESYFAICTALLFAAAAVLAVGTLSRRRLVLALSVVSAGLFVSQAARVHPLCWKAAAMLPLVVLLGPGPLKRRLLLTLGAGIGIGLVVLLTTGLEMRGVLGGSLGQHWLPGLSRLKPSLRLSWTLTVTVMLAAGFVVAARRRRRALLAGAVLVAVAALHEYTSLIQPVTRVVTLADLAQWAPVLLTAIGVGLSEMSPGRWPARAAAAVVVLVFAIVELGHARAMTRLPTDALEARAMLGWRAGMGNDDQLLYVSEVGRRMVQLPVYDSCAGPGPGRVARLVAPFTLPPPGGFARRVYYLHTSVCDSPDGAPVCGEAERWFRTHGFRMVPVHELRLPARLSMVGLGYAGAPVPITLFRLEREAAKNPP